MNRVEQLMNETGLSTREIRQVLRLTKGLSREQLREQLKEAEENQLFAELLTKLALNSLPFEFRDDWTVVVDAPGGATIANMDELTVSCFIDWWIEDLLRQ